MTDSILNTIKKLLGIPTTDTAFDDEILTHINSVMMTLQQLGVGPDEVFSIEDANGTWSQFLVNPSMYAAVKSYIYLKVRLLFDPPTNSFLTAAIQKQIDELEFRLSVQVPIPPEPVTEPEEE
jgi:hypothetical protein